MGPWGLGTILALFARTRTGAVQRVDGNLLNSAVLLSSPWFTRYAGKPERPLADKEQYGLNPFHRLYRLKDGWVYVTARDETERAALCALADLEQVWFREGWVDRFDLDLPRDAHGYGQTPE